MGKRITQQARGKGSLTFRVRPRSYRHKISYQPLSYNGLGKIVKLINSPGHSAPLAKIEVSVEKDKKKEKIDFIIPAAEGVYEGQEIYIGIRPENKSLEPGDILNLKDIKQGTKVFNIESVPGNGGKILRSGGSSAIIGIKENKKVEIIIKRRKIKLNENCRAVIGVAAGDGRKIKPLVKAGKQFYRMKAVGRKWHRTSAIKVNAIDHPFGSGRGKRIKSKIAKRNSPPGLKVGHIRPRKTGRRKGR
ncbi:MAG: 50S ribosomal protein L2 [archaeon]